MRLDDKAECTVRNRELIIDMVISILLLLLLLMPNMRKVPVNWVLVPVILLAPILIVRESIIRTRNKRL